jgi:hypothetical protein
MLKNKKQRAGRTSHMGGTCLLPYSVRHRLPAMTVSRKPTTSYFRSWRIAGGLQEVGINYMNYETCNDLCDDGIVYDIIYSAMLCAGVLAAAKIVAKATPAVRRTASMRRYPSWVDSRAHWR